MFHHAVPFSQKQYHDRFIIIDKKQAYHLGASLKDLGKKIFGFSKIDVSLIQYQTNLLQIDN